MHSPHEDTQPWYRQFWPWFLISIPAGTIIAAMFTINMAIDSSDGLVSDDYYKEGLAVNMDAARAETAHRLGLQAQLHLDMTDGRIEIQLNEAAVGQLSSLTLSLAHPTRANQDQRIELSATAGNGLYVGQIQALEAANWRVSLEPPAADWRLDGRLSITSGKVTGISSTALQ